MTAASDGQHSLSVVVDPSNTFTSGLGLRGAVPIPSGSPTMTVNTLAIEETLDVQRGDHVDGDDPLPLPEVPFTAEESEGFGVDDIEIPVPPALGNNVSNNVGPVAEDENVAGSSVDLRKYLTIAKNKRGAAVLNFFTKQARDPEAKGSDCHVYCCNVCQKSYPSIGSFYYHFAIHSRSFACQKCGESCHSRAHLRTHMQCHGVPCQNKCKECGREFTTFSNLNRHMKTHTDDRPFECTVCNKRFREKKSLQIHGRVHSGERPYQCDICASRFVQLGALNAHRETHADIRRHLCDLCGKSFRQKVQLKMHTLRHEGKKGFQCEKCPMAFNVLNDLKRHRRSHMQDKPFKCDECGKSFPRQQALTEHLNRHYGNRPYQCPFCTKSYPEMSACKKHIKTHEGSKPSGSSQTSTGESAVALPAATSR
ncbi:oocyte zinc finger protein XlCOF6.1-like [Pollicipes pollicipes]|nr:oocyte zinc finger protein XlCOF6.1-like [Pollicipes pollicipes]